MLFKETVTIFHYDNDDNLIKVYADNSFSDFIISDNLDRGETDIKKLIVLSKNSELLTNQKNCQTGDLIVPYFVKNNYKTERELREKEDVYTIQSVYITTRGTIPHIQIKGA